MNKKIFLNGHLTSLDLSRNISVFLSASVDDPFIPNGGGGDAYKQDNHITEAWRKPIVKRRIEDGSVLIACIRVLVSASSPWCEPKMNCRTELELCGTAHVSVCRSKAAANGQECSYYRRLHTQVPSGPRDVLAFALERLSYIQKWCCKLQWLHSRNEIYDNSNIVIFCSVWYVSQRSTPTSLQRLV